MKQKIYQKNSLIYIQNIIFNMDIYFTEIQLTRRDKHEIINLTDKVNTLPDEIKK